MTTYALLSNAGKIVKCPLCGRPLAWRDLRPDADYDIRIDPDWVLEYGPASDPKRPRPYWHRSWERLEAGHDRVRRAQLARWRDAQTEGLEVNWQHGALIRQSTDMECGCKAIVRVSPRRLGALTMNRVAKQTAT